MKVEDLKVCPNCSTSVEHLYNVDYGRASAVVCSVCIEHWKRKVELNENV